MDLKWTVRVASRVKDQEFIT